MSCGQYYVKRNPYEGKQPPATVKQMPPPPMQQQINPRDVAAFLSQMQGAMQPGMSQSDSISIVNMPKDAPIVAQNYVDADQQAMEAFGRSILGQRMAQPYQSAASDEQMNALIRKRSSEILADAIGYGNPGEVTITTMSFGPGGPQYYGG